MGDRMVTVNALLPDPFSGPSTVGRLCGSAGIGSVAGTAAVAVTAGAEHPAMAARPAKTTAEMRARFTDASRIFQT